MNIEEINFNRAEKVFESMHGEVEIENVFAADVLGNKQVFYIQTKELLTVIEDDEIQTTIHTDYIKSINHKDNTISLTLTTGEHVDIYSGYPMTAEAIVKQLRESILS